MKTTGTCRLGNTGPRKEQREITREDAAIELAVLVEESGGSQMRPVRF